MNILDKIVIEKINHLKYLNQKNYNIKKNKSSFFKAIKKEIKNGNNALIAEFKRFSPSVNKFKQIKFLQNVISDYDKSNCCCISILTDKNFGGSLNDLLVAKKITKKPIIRKDFIINHKQIEESKYYGADAILLIAKILTKKKLTELYNYSLELGLDVLIEIENKNELKKTSEIDAKLIGINNRNLREQKIDINKSIELAKLLENIVIVSESGVNKKNIKSIKQRSNISSFLIGGSILNQNDKTTYINNLYKS
tara:strand:- start:1369 stop:2127 length:759 start_codon:yes stop_codon:yes gene_type:complete